MSSQTQVLSSNLITHQWVLHSQAKVVGKLLFECLKEKETSSAMSNANETDIKLGIFSAYMA